MNFFLKLLGGFLLILLLKFLLFFLFFCNILLFYGWLLYLRWLLIRLLLRSLFFDGFFRFFIFWLLFFLLTITVIRVHRPVWRFLRGCLFCYHCWVFNRSDRLIFIIIFSNLLKLLWSLKLVYNPSTSILMVSFDLGSLYFCIFLLRLLFLFNLLISWFLSLPFIFLLRFFLLLLDLLFSLLFWLGLSQGVVLFDILFHLHEWLDYLG